MYVCFVNIDNKDVLYLPIMIEEHNMNRMNQFYFMELLACFYELKNVSSFRCRLHSSPLRGSSVRSLSF